MNQFKKRAELIAVADAALQRKVASAGERRVLVELVVDAIMLEPFGLTTGQAVRFRTKSGSNWTMATVYHVEDDGSLCLTTGRGLRSIRPAAIQVRSEGPRGGHTWKNLA